ncbi:MAG: XdhC family protein [Actinomycetales bacterium]|nr:XdhC family protein [Actinomycetales bacterium]
MPNGETSESMEVLERAVELVRSGQSFAMATVVWRKPPSSGHHGSRAIVMPDGTLLGWIGGACAEPVLIREARRVLEQGSPALVWLGQQEDFDGMHVPDGVMTVPISCQSDGALQIFIEPVLAAPQVLIVGRSPMTHTLADLVRSLGWSGEVVDGDDFHGGLVLPTTSVIVATQGHGDEEVLRAALEAEPCFVGLVASRRRGETVRGTLADWGVPAELLDRVHVPIGLDLGHTTHREIAVAILAELVQLRAAGALTAQATVSAQGPAEVIDLVCGMTVQAVPSNRPFAYQGSTYYFCAPGCRTAFENDPVSFTQQEVPC